MRWMSLFLRAGLRLQSPPSHSKNRVVWASPAPRQAPEPPTYEPGSARQPGEGDLLLCYKYIMYIRNMTLKYYSVTEKILRLSIIYIKQASTLKKNQTNKSALLASDIPLAGWMPRECPSKCLSPSAGTVAHNMALWPEASFLTSILEAGGVRWGPSSDPNYVLSTWGGQTRLNEDWGWGDRSSLRVSFQGFSRAMVQGIYQFLRIPRPTNYSQAGRDRNDTSGHSPINATKGCLLGWDTLECCGKWGSAPSPGLLLVAWGSCFCIQAWQTDQISWLGRGQKEKKVMKKINN